MIGSETARAAPICAERDPRIERLPDQLDSLNSTPLVLEQSIEAAILAGAVRALRRRADRQVAIARAADERSGEGVIARRLPTVLSGLADDLAAVAAP